MKHSIFRTVIMGALFGATLFFMPFFMVGFFICIGIFGFFMRRRIGWGQYGNHRFAFADKIRSMNDDEYQALKEKMSNAHCCNQYKYQKNN